MNQAKNFRFEQPEDVRVQEFLDMVAPCVVKFNTDFDCKKSPGAKE